MIMMLTAYQEPAGPRPYFVHVVDLEEGCDFLNDLVAKGFTLLDVQLMDGSRPIRLPTAAFDGQSSLATMRQLEADWTSILAESSQVSLLARANRQKELTRQDNLLIQIELMYSQISRFLAFLQQNPSLSNERLAGYYESVLARYQSQALTAYGARRRLLDDPLL